MTSDKIKNAEASLTGKIRKVVASDKVKFVLKNKRTIIALIYMLSPIDLIPDAVPVIGVVDDVVPIIWAMCDMLDKTVGNDKNIVDMPEDIKENVNMNSEGYNNVKKVSDTISSVKNHVADLKAHNADIVIKEPKMQSVKPNTQFIEDQKKKTEEINNMFGFNDDEDRLT